MQGDASEIRELARDLSVVSAKLAGAAYEGFKAAGEEFAGQWRRNARQTSGTHGRHYPSSITSETRVSTSVIVDTGPQTSRRQGRMGPGFEFGSRNQQPHLDGAKAMAAMEPKIDAVIGDLIHGIVSTAEPDLVEYVTKAGVRRMATQAQVANWTRGSAA